MHPENLIPYRPKDCTDVVVQELGAELVVYHTGSQQAHCLNGTAARVWSLCNGRRTISELAAELGSEASQETNEELVWFALRNLERAGLLTAAIPVEADSRISRRQLIRACAYAAVAIPVVTSMIVPGPAAASSSVCVTAACTACTNISATATCIVGCENCLGVCSRGAADCTAGYLQYDITCTECKTAVIPNGQGGCTQPGGCSCLDGGVYAACSFAAM
jgi:hypothetical protein